MNTTPNRLRGIVARRHDLTPEETEELQGRTLAQLASHARHLVDRRAAVDAAISRNPGVPAYVIEGAYDGGGVTLDDHAGREMAVEALRDNVAGRDRRTTDVLAGIGRRTLADDKAEKHARVTQRLRDAGFGTED